MVVAIGPQHLVALPSIATISLRLNLSTPKNIRFHGSGDLVLHRQNNAKTPHALYSIDAPLLKLHVASTLL